jgi:hypothetical protein
MAFRFAATHEQQFSLLQNYGIGDLSYWNEHNNFYIRRALCGVALTCWRIKHREIAFVWADETTLGRSPIPLEWGSGNGSSRMVANAEPPLYSDGIFQLMPCVGKSVLMYWGIMLESNGRLQLKCDGKRWRTTGEVKGKLANGVGSQYPSHYLETWCIQHYYRWCANLGCQ